MRTEPPVNINQRNVNKPYNKTFCKNHFYLVSSLRFLVNIESYVEGQYLFSSGGELEGSFGFYARFVAGQIECGITTPTHRWVASIPRIDVNVWSRYNNIYLFSYALFTRTVNVTLFVLFKNGFNASSVVFTDNVVCVSRQMKTMRDS